VLLAAGAAGLGDSRIDNIETLRRAGITAPMMLIRSPLLSQLPRVVTHADVSCNTEPEVIAGLSVAAVAAGRTHGIVLMVELGDRREGIMPRDLPEVVRQTLGLPNLVLRGIGANLACQSGVVPDAANMAELSTLAGSIEADFGVVLDLVSGGNSANLDWALGDSDRAAATGTGTATAVGRINHLRLGESILLGCEPLHRRPIHGLHTDAFTLVAEVIESKIKPSRPQGTVAEGAFGPPAATRDRGDIRQAILAVGRQDIDPAGLQPPPGVEILGASSDHLIVTSGRDQLAVGSEVAFGLNYSALVRAMTSPFVATVFNHAAVDGDLSRDLRSHP
jgi:predicted amino acid racemase